MIKIGIKSWGSISPLGFSRTKVLDSYLDIDTRFLQDENASFVASLSQDGNDQIENWKQKDRLFSKCDKTVLMAVEASGQALEESGWKTHTDIGVFIGSSRGAARLLEDNHKQFLEDEPIDLLTSPLTTMGNISSIVSRYFGLSGFSDTVSMTCSSGFHAMLQAIVWLKAGMKKRFLVGGTEAPLTPFFIEQLKQLKLYSRENGEYPNHSLSPHIKKNTMILGEGAAVFAIEKFDENQTYKAVISGVGYGMEHNSNLTGVNPDGKNAQQAMKMALEGHEISSIDAIVMHAPGTVQGDMAEKIAVETIFDGHQPFLLSNKWKIGHSLGASGTLSLEMALLMLEEEKLFFTPFSSSSEIVPKKIMVNALGFGGSAISLIIEKV